MGADATMAPPPLWRRAYRAWLSLRIPLLRRRVGRLVLERVGGAPLVVLPEVFNPAVFRTGGILAEALAGRPPARPGVSRALDMGTGSGICAVHAALRGYRVTAVDINSEAVRCARVNALLNGVEDRLEARQGDLFAPVAGERFDLVLFNPPFYRGRPSGPLDAAWRGEGVMDRFAAGLGGVLAERGAALVVLSSIAGEAEMLAGLRAHGHTVAPALRRDLGNEVVTVYEARRAGDRGLPVPGDPCKVRLRGLGP